MKRLSSLITCICILFAFSSVASSEDRFGAFAVAENGAYGYAWAHYSKSEARRTAMNECRRRGPGCRNALWFRNACGALAMNSRNSWATEWSESRAGARDRALNSCNNKFGGCRIREAICSWD
ncbi:DUF4189 domain-containing protein [Cohaesibacter sp. ES.047]|uniref:DUF4189 domain-containing protein n=1 Tax=Cohaesibacter sp. ES.047 TaxID=1798205 RepID=UPI00156164D1|nr:DUF4189 domain-containing protein [Cohaesibacter sp. ES.047]